MSQEHRQAHQQVDTSVIEENLATGIALKSCAAPIIVGVVGDALKLAVTAPPVEGKANQAVIEFFAEFFAIPRSSVSIASGETSRNKVVRVNGISVQRVRDLLARAQAH